MMGQGRPLIGWRRLQHHQIQLPAEEKLTRDVLRPRPDFLDWHDQEKNSFCCGEWVVIERVMQSSEKIIYPRITWTAAAVSWRPGIDPHSNCNPNLNLGLGYNTPEHNGSSSVVFSSYLTNHDPPSSIYRQGA